MESNIPMLKDDDDDVDVDVDDSLLMVDTPSRIGTDDVEERNADANIVDNIKTRKVVTDELAKGAFRRKGAIVVSDSEVCFVQ